MVSIRDIRLRKNNKNNKKSNSDKDSKALLKAVTRKIISSRPMRRPIDSSTKLPTRYHDYRYHHPASTRFLSIALIVILASSAAITPYNGNAIFNGILSIPSLFGQANATPGITYPNPPTPDTYDYFSTVCTEADLFNIDPSTGLANLTAPQHFPVQFGENPELREVYKYRVEFGPNLSPEQQALFDQGLLVIGTFDPIDPYDANFNSGLREEVVDTIPFGPLFDFVKPPDSTGKVSTIIARTQHVTSGHLGDPNDPNNPINQLKAGAPFEGDLMGGPLGPPPPQPSTFKLTSLKFCAGQPSGPDTIYTSLDMSHNTGAILPPAGGTVMIPESSPGSGSATFRWALDATNYQLRDTTINNPNGVLHPLTMLTCNPGVFTDPNNAPQPFTPSTLWEHTFIAAQNPTTVTCEVGTEPNTEYPNGEIFKLGHSKLTFNVQVTQAQQPQGPTLCAPPGTCQAIDDPDHNIVVSGAGFAPGPYTITVEHSLNPSGATLPPLDVIAPDSGAITVVWNEATLQGAGFGYASDDILTAKAYDANNQQVAIAEFPAGTEFQPQQPQSTTFFAEAQFQGGFQPPIEYEVTPGSDPASTPFTIDFGTTFSSVTKVTQIASFTDCTDKFGNGDHFTAYIDGIGTGQITDLGDPEITKSTIETDPMDNIRHEKFLDGQIQGRFEVESGSLTLTKLIYIVEGIPATSTGTGGNPVQPVPPTLSGATELDGSVSVCGAGLDPNSFYQIVLSRQVSQSGTNSVPSSQIYGTDAYGDLVPQATFTTSYLEQNGFYYQNLETLTATAHPTDQFGTPNPNRTTFNPTSFTATTSFQQQQVTPIVTISSGPTPPTPKWGINEITVQVVVPENTDTNPQTHIVLVDWGDGITSTIPLSSVPLDVDSQNRTWTADHLYGQEVSGQQLPIVAKLIEQDTSTDPPTVTEKARSNTVGVLVQGHATSLSLDRVDNMYAGSTWSAIGDLIDTDTGEEVSGRQITFVENNVLSPGLQPTTTGGVNFTAPSTSGEEGEEPGVIQVVACPTVSAGGTCTPDEGLKDNGTNTVVHLFANNAIRTPVNTDGVMVYAQDMGTNVATLEVTYYDGTVVASNIDPTLVIAGDPAGVRTAFVDGRQHEGGIKQIRITNVNDGQTGGSSPTAHVGISALRIHNINTQPQDMATFDFEDLAPSSGGEEGTVYESPLSLNKGLFFSDKVAQATPATNPPLPSVQAVFAGDSAYGPSESQVQQYQVLEDNGYGISGEAATTNPYSASLYTTVTCAAGGDDDNDGICDDWEVNGVPYTTTSNTAARYSLCFVDRFSNVWTESQTTAGTTTGTLTTGVTVCPKVGHKDVFLELDAMAGHLNGASSSTNPDTIAIKRVIKAYGNAPVTNAVTDHFGRSGGVTLHVVLSDLAITHSNDVNVWTDPVGGSATPSFAELKAANFGLNSAAERTNAQWSRIDDAKSSVYHYGLFIHGYGGQACNPTASPPTGSPSGIAEINGNDLVVALGCGFGDSVANTHNTGVSSDGTSNEKAGTLMHELGHNGGLAHGGPVQLLNTAATATTNAIYSTALSTPPSPPAADTNMNCKPNYMSVMSYSRQLPTTLLTGATWQSRGLDYSRVDIPDLVESGLSETTGMAHPQGQTAVYGIPTKSTTGSAALSTAGTATSINWNGDATTGGTVSQDANKYAGITGCDGTGTTLKGFDDWRNMKFDFKGVAASFDGVWPQNMKVEAPEVTGGIYQDLQKLNNQYAGVLQPVNDDGTSIFKIGDTVNLRFRLLDPDGNPVPNAKITFTLKKVSNQITGTVREAASAGTPSTGTLFAVDANSVYHYEWGTRGLTQGTYDLSFIKDNNTPASLLLSNGKNDALHPGAYSVRVSLSQR